MMSVSLDKRVLLKKVVMVYTVGLVLLGSLCGGGGK